MSRFSVAKAKVLDDLDAIIVQLLHGKRKYRRSNLWNIANPFRTKSSESQMVVWLTGARKGGWKDFVNGDSGDAIDLVAYGLTGSVDADSRMTALEWIEDRFGLKDLSPQRRQQITAEAKASTLAAEAKDAAAQAKAIERSRKFFYSCQPIEGSLAEIYLRQARGVELSQVPALGRSLRFHPECEYWMDPGRPRLPAMIAAMVDQDGKIGACHYTFLKADGSDKADIQKSKLMWPATSGLVIRLTDGASGLPVKQAAAQHMPGLCGLCEGIEDGLSVAIANAELRVWAAGSLGGLLSVPDHAAVSGWLIFKDNDWGKPQATRLFNRAVARIKGFRKPVETISMPADWGKDVNDAIRSGWE